MIIISHYKSLNSKAMTRIILSILVLAISSSVFAQTGSSGAPSKPSNIGIKEFDNFKNSSFDLYQKSAKYKTMVESNKELSPDNLKDFSSIAGNLQTLLSQSDNLVAKAKKLNTLQAIKATRSMTSSIQALNACKKNTAFVKNAIGNGQKQTGSTSVGAGTPSGASQGTTSQTQRTEGTKTGTKKN